MYRYKSDYDITKIKEFDEKNADIWYERRSWKKKSEEFKLFWTRKIFETFEK